MSLILEALKKSEQQRQREKAPGLQSIHQPVTVAAKKSTQRWWLLAGFLIICNFAALGYWFWRLQNAATPISQTTPPVAPATTPTPTAAQTATTQLQEAETTQPEFTRISPQGAPSSSAPTDSAQRIEEISELPDSVRNNLPAMTFSFHVYSESPEQRTIIINDRRVREGDEISAGLKLQSITPDGVILLFEQHRIHISVLSDW